MQNKFNSHYLNLKTPQQFKRVEGTFYPKKQRQQHSNYLRSKHFNLEWDNPNSIQKTDMKSYSQDQFKSMTYENVTKNINQLHKNKEFSTKMVYSNNVQLSNQKNAQTYQTSHQHDYYQKDIPDTDECSAQKNELRKNHFVFGSDNQFSAKCRHSSLENINEKDKLQEEQMKRKKFNVSHNFCFGKDLTNYSTSNTTMGFYDKDLNLIRAKLQKQDNNIQLGGAHLKDNEDEINRKNYHFKQQNNTTVGFDLKKSYLNLGKFQSETRSQYKQQYEPKKQLEFVNNQMEREGRKTFFKQSHFQIGNNSNKPSISTAQEAFADTINLRQRIMTPALTIKSNVNMQHPRSISIEDQYSTTYIKQQNSPKPKTPMIYETPQKYYKNQSHLFMPKTRMAQESEQKFSYKTPTKASIDTLLKEKLFNQGAAQKQNFTIFNKDRQVVVNGPSTQSPITDMGNSCVKANIEFLKTHHFSLGNHDLRQKYQAVHNKVELKSKVPPQNEQVHKTNVSLGIDKNMRQTHNQATYMWIQPKVNK